MGRPKKLEIKKRSEGVVCYLTKTEFELLKLKADKADISYSDYMRKVFLDHLKALNMD